MTTDSDQTLEIIASGLPAQPGRSKTILIAGAGMAGLTAAYKLWVSGILRDVCRGTTASSLDKHHANSQ